MEDVGTKRTVHVAVLPATSFSLLKGRAGLIQTCMELYDRLLHCGLSTSAAAEIINDLHTEKQVKILESFLRMQELMDNDESEYV